MASESAQGVGFGEAVECLAIESGALGHIHDAGERRLPAGQHEAFGRVLGQADDLVEADADGGLGCDAFVVGAGMTATFGIDRG
jgi:hypothetical protein